VVQQWIKSPMNAPPAESITQLTAGMLGAKLYVVRWHSRVPATELMPLLESHLSYMLKLEKSGTLFASGPIKEADGRTQGSGLTILRVASAEEACALADGDPFVCAGLRRYDLNEWSLLEGSLDLRITFSDQRADIR
jgi:uncharacterized protein YciI